MSLKTYYDFTSKINWKTINYKLRKVVFERLQKDFESTREYRETYLYDNAPNGYELGLTTNDVNPVTGRLYSDNELKARSVPEFTVETFLKGLYNDRCYQENGLTIFRLDNDETNYINYLQVGVFAS